LTALGMAGVVVAGCGGGSTRGASGHTGHAATTTPIVTSAAVGPTAKTAPSPGCAATVMYVLGHVAQRIYGEALSSNTTITAQRMVSSSRALGDAVARGDAAAARAAIQTMITTGHMGRVRVTVGGRVFVDVGAPLALGSLRGSLAPGPGGAPVTYALSVQDARGLLSATQGLTSGALVVMSGQRVLATHLAQVPASIPAAGQVRVHGQMEQAYSFPARTFDGAPARISLLRPVRAASALCGRDAAQTRALTAGYVGLHVYNQEARGGTVVRQVQRTMRSSALVAAVARGDRRAARAAVVALLNQHIVRLRVLRGRQLIADVGGPHVLAPVGAPLGGGSGGQLVLSVQDDLGYVKLASRLIGVQVLLRDAAGQVMGTLSPGPPSVPDLGPVSWAGRRYEAFSFRATKFPSGTLRISLLVPLG
jgi:hypothetical protein